MLNTSRMQTGSNDEDDPVCAEVDVFLSQALSEQLFLFQYPMSPAHVTCDYAGLKEIKWKPLAQKLQLDLSVEPSGENYSDSRGESYATYMEMGKPPGTTELYYPSGLMDRRTLSSSQNLPTGEVERYAVGVLRGSELHLSSLKGVHQLRPSFDYLNSVGAGQKKSQLGSVEGAGSESSQEEEEAKLQKVTFSPRHGNQTSVPQDVEAWLHLHPNSFQDQVADRTRALLFSSVDTELSSCSLDTKTYFDSLVPRQDISTGSSYSLDGLQGLPLQDAMKAVLIRVGVLSYKDLCALVLGKHPQSQEEEVLPLLTTMAALVQGCWVAQSSLLYPESYTSSHNKVSHSVMAAARDLILLKFALTSGSVVTRKEIADQVGIPQEELGDILAVLARRSKEGPGWVFRMAMDRDFLVHHPDVVAKQLEMWKSHQERLRVSLLRQSTEDCGEAARKALGRRRKGSQGRPAAKEDPPPLARLPPGAAKPTAPPPPPGDCPRGTRGPVGGVRGGSPRDSGVVESGSVATARPLVGGHQQGEAPVGNEGGVSMDVWRAPWLAELLEGCVGAGVVPLLTIRQSLDHHLSSVNPTHQLATANDETLVRGLLVAGVTEVVPKEQGEEAKGPAGRLFVRRCICNHTDRCREVVLKMLEQNTAVRKKAVCEEVHRSTGEEPDVKLVTAVLKDLCRSRGALWYMNRT